MAQLIPAKLHVKFAAGATADGSIIPRAYTLTHSDATGDLFLTIGLSYNRAQVSGWYTRLMRDEVLAEWHNEKEPSLQVHCHVSGGLVVGGGRWRADIFRNHLPLVLQAFRYGDAELFHRYPELGGASIWVHFHAREEELNRIEQWGKLDDYRIES